MMFDELRKVDNKLADMMGPTLENIPQGAVDGINKGMDAMREIQEGRAKKLRDAGDMNK